MKTTVFIDGQHGTTGLRIHERLKDRDELEIVSIPEESKKDIDKKAKVINDVDVVFLCLPDQAARESVSLIRNENVKVIDPSTAHRISDDWVYGIPELNANQRNAIATSKRVTNPGCHATGFIMIMHPLVSSGIVPENFLACCHSISGYSGGGKQMIREYEKEAKGNEAYSCRVKNLDLNHKHLPEMKKYGLLNHEPIFSSIVGDFYSGMLVFVPIDLRYIEKVGSSRDLRSFFEEYYGSENFVRVASEDEIESIGPNFISPVECNETNNIELLVFEKGKQAICVARFDNLGKGASGAAVQNMNIMIGAPENKGL